MPLLAVRLACSGLLVTLLLALLFVFTCRLLSARTVASTRLLSLCMTLSLRATPPLPLLPSAASCCRTCSLTWPPLPQSLTSSLTSALVTPATALRFPPSFAPRTPPLMYITFVYLVTRLPDSLRSVRDHFLSLCPTELTVDLLEERLTTAETSIVAVEASRGDPRAPFFEGCSPVPLLPSVASSAAIDLVGTEEHRGETCRLPHTTQRCFGRLSDAWRAQFPDAAELPRWADLLKSGVAIFDLDFDAILAAMYAVTISAEGDCYLCVPPDPVIEVAALGASESAAPGTSESALSGTTPAEALHMIDSGASRSFFRDSTTLTPLSRPVAVSLADPSGGPVLAHTSMVLPCLADLSGSLSVFTSPRSLRSW
ncbi:unnamed protein product [Closterium sp. NIES-65]|nr:unnamed protein product [Closterium sp. NIES-65]